MNIGIGESLRLIPHEFFCSFNHVPLALKFLLVFLPALLQKLLPLPLIVLLLFFGNVTSERREHLRIDFLLGIVLHKGRLFGTLQYRSSLLHFLLSGLLEGGRLLQDYRMLV